MKIESISPLLGRGLKCSQARYWTVIGKYYEGDKGNKLAGKGKSNPCLFPEIESPSQEILNLSWSWELG